LNPGGTSARGGVLPTGGSSDTVKKEGRKHPTGGGKLRLEVLGREPPSGEKIEVWGGKKRKRGKNGWYDEFDG